MLQYYRYYEIIRPRWLRLQIPEFQAQAISLFLIINYNYKKKNIIILTVKLFEIN